MNPQHNRFKDAPWYKPDVTTHIYVGGAGGIGSWTALLLSRAGFSPVVYDFDILENHNLGGQLFPRKSIGDTKVVALQSVIMDFCGDQIIGMEERMDESTSTNLYCISAFDNMLARKQMFTNWVTVFKGHPDAIFMDGRLNAEQMQIFCVKANDEVAIKTYMEEHLFDDSEVEDAPCTLKQTSHAAAMIASHIVGFFTNHFTNVVEKEVVRTVPFLWEYFIPMDLIDVKT